MPQTESLILISLAVGLLINVFFCLTLYNTLLQVKPENRELNPIHIWLLLIPFVSLIAAFYIIYRLSNSIGNELLDRNYELTEKPGYNLGMGFAIIGVLIVIPMPPAILGILGLIGIVLFIQYWVKINWYRKVLKDDLLETENQP